MPPENGSTRREELLAVATKLFAARGYHGTRMDDVADVLVRGSISEVLVALVS